MSARQVRRTIKGTWLLHLALLAGAGCSVPRAAAPPAPVPPRTASIDDPVVRELADRINAHRRRLGRPVLQWDARVAAVAARHSRNMVEQRFFSHTDHRGRSPFDRLDEAGIGFSKAAENIASGQRGAEAVLDAWLSSEGHRRNLEEPAYTRHGIGRFANHWTHVLIRPPVVR